MADMTTQQFAPMRVLAPHLMSTRCLRCEQRFRFMSLTCPRSAGPVIWENPGYVSPNDLRAAAKQQVAGKYTNKIAKRAARRVHKAQNAIPKTELDDLFK